jgi:Zn-dependent protease with chaperone function
VGLGAACIALVVAGHAGALIKIALIPLAFSWTVLRAMMGRVPPPEGALVDRKDAPALFDAIDDVRAQLQTLPVHRVVVDAETFNAGVAQIPRLGIFGWPRNYLVLGLPLLESLTQEEFRFVLGHELGHLSKKQARFRNWIYRMRQSWPRLQMSVAANHRFASGLVTRFLDWYAPYFNAYTFVLARANEYDADHAGAGVSSVAAAAGALTVVNTVGGFLERRFWPLYFARAVDEEQPPRAPFSDYLRASRETPAPEIETALRVALAKKTSLADTHPSLLDRLEALRARGPAPQPQHAPASAALLGPLRERLITETDAKWAANIGERWRAAHERGQELRHEISDAAQNFDALNGAQLARIAGLVEETEGGAKADPWLKAALERDPHCAQALFMRGRLQLAHGEGAGVEEIEAAMRADPEAVEAGSNLLYSYFLGQRDIARCQPFLENLQRIETARAEAQAEWSKTSAKDTFGPADLTPEQCARFETALKTNRKIKRAWLARKTLKLSPERRLYVAVAEFSWLHKVTQQELQDLLGALPPEVDRRVLSAQSHKAVARRLRAIADIYTYTRR